jgi:hypothetical protein
MRYEAKLWLTFDANTDAEARNTLGLLTQDLHDALSTTSQDLTVGATLALEDDQPERVNE